jgi:hypothetical protein
MQLLQPLRFERKPDGAALVLWLCEPFDQEYSFRGALEELAQAMRAVVPDRVSYRLPAEQPVEDFVEGQLTWNDRQFDLYYERSLGYMQFSSVNVPGLEALHAILQANSSFQRTPDRAAEFER